MRLIDADKITFFDCLAKTGNGICCHAKGIVSKEEIDEMPTVKAIPIDWLKKFANERALNDGMDCYWHFWGEDLLQMIDRWEKENE